MRIALIADTYSPLRTSGAVQLRDLAREFIRQGHLVTVLLPSSEVECDWVSENIDEVHVLRLRSPRTKDVGYFRRTLSELVMPFSMLRSFRKSPFAGVRWEGVVWYSPSIFHAPFVSALKNSSRCKGYLIIRDIFPNWALDMGLMRRGLIYRFFDLIARYQYSVADVIGVQTSGNRKYFDTWQKGPGRRLEVLQNWLADSAQDFCSINLAETSLAGRKVFVYAGNMGVAQSMSVLLAVAACLRDREDLGFLFVGRGSEANALASDAEAQGLDNVLFLDEIPPDEIPGLYAQCCVGLVSLDSRHKTHNIPGKFLSYMQAGLPVLASLNAGNDLTGLIIRENVGRVSEDGSSNSLAALALSLIGDLQKDIGIRSRCRALYLRKFSPEFAVKQIVSSIDNSGSLMSCVHDD
jgi:glycosyltransferase involved in cell wall biosynthesis